MHVALHKRCRRHADVRSACNDYPSHSCNAACCKLRAARVFSGEPSVAACIVCVGCSTAALLERAEPFWRISGGALLKDTVHGAPIRADA